MRTLAIGSAALGLLAVGLASASPATAVDPAAFDAPLLGTTATAQATRLPSVAEVRCSDAACASGVLADPSFDFVEYATDTFLREAGFTRLPEFRKGVFTTWKDGAADKDATALASFVIAEYAPGSDMRAIAVATAALTGTPLSERQVDGTTVLVGQVVNDNDDDNIYTGTAFRSAFVLGTDSLVRAGCQLGGSAVQESPCTVDGLARIALAIAARPPAAPDRAVLAKVPPRAATPGLDPQVVVSAGSANAWADSIDDKALAARLSGKPTAMAQYALPGFSSVHVSTLATRGAKGSDARAFLAAPCDGTAKLACEKRTVAPGIVRLTYTLKDDSAGEGSAGKVAGVVVRGSGKGSVVEAVCGKRLAISGPFSGRELARCTSALGRTVAAAIR